MVWPPVALSAICPQASAATWVSRFPIVGRLNQFHEYSFSYNNGLMSFPLDKDAVSGMYLGFSEFGNMASSTVPITDSQKRTAVYDIIKNINGVTEQIASPIELDWNRLNFDSPLWS